jgi:transcriptional regulator GlxA family with amidase domain
MPCFATNCIRMRSELIDPVSLTSCGNHGTADVLRHVARRDFGLDLALNKREGLGFGLDRNAEGRVAQKAAFQTGVHMLAQVISSLDG